jgi:capsular exopolysaccharide synthesis family protein
VSVVDPIPPAPAAVRAEGALEPYLRALRAHWKLVVAVTIAALLGSIAWVTVRSPDYEATAKLLVSPLAQDDPAFEGIDVIRTDVTDSTRTLQTAATLVDSPDAAEGTAKALDAGWTRGSVEGAVEVETQGESNILSVTARAGSPEEAARLANVFTESSLDARASAIRPQIDATLERLEAEQAAGSRTGEAAAELAGRIDRLETAREEGDPAFSLTQKAFPPGGPIQTPAWIVVALALIAGFTLATVAALLLELFERRVRDEDELRRIYPLPVLAHVPEVSRRQQRRLRSPQTTPPAVKEAFRTLQVQLDRSGERPRALMLTSASSGDAKTTSAVTLAIQLVAAGHRVILLDLDLRKPDVGRALRVQSRQRLSSLLTPDTSLAELLVEATGIPDLHVLPADGEHEVLLLDALNPRLPELFEEARQLADYIVVDTPPLGEVSDALRLVDLVDDVLIVARPGNTNRANLELMRNLMARTGHSPTGLIVIGEPPGTASTYYTYGMHARHQRTGLPFARSAKQ